MHNGWHTIETSVRDWTPQQQKGLTRCLLCRNCYQKLYRGKGDTNCEYCGGITLRGKDWHKQWIRSDAHVGKCWHEEWTISWCCAWRKYGRIIKSPWYFIDECREIIVKLHGVMYNTFCSWFANVMRLVLLLSFFKAGECCRRDALNFSHHQTMPKGVFNMVSLVMPSRLTLTESLHCYRFID